MNSRVFILALVALRSIALVRAEPVQEKPVQVEPVQVEPVQAEPVQAETVELLNVSYDPTREVFEEINKRFVSVWRAQRGQEVSVYQSHGGSGKQSRAVIDGLEADVVTLALALDIDRIAGAGLLPVDWQKKLPYNSAPYRSTIVFVVRTGNPKEIKDWADLAREGIEVVTPNPKTSGAARWNYLAAWGYAKKVYGDETRVRDFMRKLLSNVSVFDTGARGATTTFLERGIGDVLLAWENEAHLALKAARGEGVEIVVPSLSIIAEPPVAVVEKNARAKGTLEVAQAYLKFLYRPEVQGVLAQYHLRPSDPVEFEKVKDHFPPMELLTIDKDFGGWAAAQKAHFDEGASFDQAVEAH